MKYKLIIITFILFYAIGSYGANVSVIPEFSEDTLPIHTENIRKLNDDLISVIESASENTASIDTAYASVDTLESTVTIVEASVITGQTVLKGWIHFVGIDTISIQDSYNVTSIPDNDTGDYTVTWDTDFASATYVVVSTADRDGSDIATTMTDAKAVGSVGIRCLDINGDPVDCREINVMATGDQ